MIELSNHIDEKRGDTKVMKELKRINKPKDWLKKLRDAEYKIKSKDPCDKI